MIEQRKNERKVVFENEIETRLNSFRENVVIELESSSL